VCHVAIGGFPVDPNAIDYTVNSTKKLLEVASREPLIRRFVYTSSITAAFSKSFDGLFTVDENTWNRQVVEVLTTPTPGSNMPDPITRALTLYGASKVLAEWEIYSSNNGSMEVNSGMSVGVAMI
jgi:nucleoside-diphosphate-sugar epimerase